MKGMELCEAYFREVGYPALREETPELLPYLTVGLVGQGSECLGFDDACSQDHDWGASFAMWLPTELYQRHRTRLEGLYAALPKDFRGYPPRLNGAEAQGRDGLLETDAFYFRLLGVRGAPKGLADWLRAPEHAFACAVNGRLFLETNSEFERIRRVLLDYYPEDIRKKKLAARAVQLAQSGQYNYPRCIRRGEKAAALMCLSEFMQAACSMIHLLNKKYVPFYKWAHRSVCTMERLSDLGVLLTELADTADADACSARIEEICGRIAQELRRQELSSLTDSFLAPHGNEIMKTIEDPQVRALPVLFG